MSIYSNIGDLVTDHLLVEDSSVVHPIFAWFLGTTQIFSSWYFFVKSFVFLLKIPLTLCYKIFKNNLQVSQTLPSLCYILGASDPNDSVLPIDYADRLQIHISVPPTYLPRSHRLCYLFYPLLNLAILHFFDDPLFKKRGREKLYSRIPNSKEEKSYKLSVKEEEIILYVPSVFNALYDSTPFMIPTFYDPCSQGSLLTPWSMCLTLCLDLFGN